MGGPSYDGRLERKAAVGLSEGKLIFKLNRRRHMAGGSKLVRVCICEHYDQDTLELHVPQLFCPVCQLWPAIRRLAATGEQLAPWRTGKKVLTDLRAFGESREWRKAGRLGTQSFRRGAAWAVLEAGGFFSQLLRAGRWRSSAYQLFLGRRLDLVRGIGRRMTRSSSSSSKSSKVRRP